MTSSSISSYSARLKRLSSGSYPIQNSDYAPHPVSAPAPAPVVVEEVAKTPIPASIRACKDASHANQQGRTIVVCLDGTGDQFDNDNSNVVHFVSCLKKHDPNKQATYYQSGIGTYDKGGLKNGIGAAMDGAVGSGLGVHIVDAYKFLMQNYREGDRICLLGFSRGAYTVRCLAGMLHKVGLLPASNHAQVNFAYDFYKNQTEEGWKMSADFKKTFCTDVNVYFVGVWDCVASVGFLPRKLPFSKSPTNSIGYFRHAMALDEHRAKFKICQWQQQDPGNNGAQKDVPHQGIDRRTTFDDTPKAKFKRTFNCFGSGKEEKALAQAQENAAAEKKAKNARQHSFHIHDDEDESDNQSAKTVEQTRLETSFNALDAKNRTNPVCKTDALEVWFMGAHADIGGGAVPNERRHMLSRIPLRWMLRQCFECNTGILFDVAALAEQGLDIHTLYPVYQPPTQPTAIPLNSVVERYETKTLPAIQDRSKMLPIGEEPYIAPPFAPNSDHHYAHLPECTEEHFDSLEPLNDQLVQAKGWWLLELWPVKVRILQRDGDGWVKKVRCNLGRYRAIRDREPKMHWTVQRMIDEGKYVCKGRTDNKTVWKVVA
ncbi:hypothetical protein BLS_003231 [Venturia inaequalis]|uniref:T6SS Phospholipase effector Tle1-like catalytic domain-containing protein n=1 Tax=Venturia inaequalis TaxID=5025 RepID=A0A8H3VQJ9_VENIN|nr:hypothetical protein BLS_003231 [Venturia inaequalis]KAE9964705.1 hypothetical protein EG328_010270 [Venturia inaequalis]KAE9993554.1 hypothetical protein EG327_004565 [Venturia inaequalis]